MADKIKIIQDISLLYELSLSVGSSLDPEENCHSFLRTLISRKSLSFGSIWLIKPASNRNTNCDLFYIIPNFQQLQTSITCSNETLQELSTKPYFTVGSQDPRFKDLLHEKKVGKGSYAIFKLGNWGFLKLFASNRPDGFSQVEMAQLKQVVDKLKTALDGCFAYIQLKDETANRLITQKALEESENKLRRIIDSPLDAVVSANLDGNAIEWNAQAEKMFGYTRQEVLGQPLRDLLIPQRHWYMFQNAQQDYLSTTNETIVNRRYEIKCVRKNGTEFPAELSITADRTGDTILFVGFIRDTTEQKKAKAEIEQNRMRLENLIANLQAGILLEDKDRKIVLVNQSFCDIFSLPITPEALIGADCAQAVIESKGLFKYPEAFVDFVASSISNKALITNQVFELANGRILECDYIPLYSIDKHQGHLWQYRDVTERQNTQQAIRESEEKYRGVLQNMDLGLLEVDLDDNILRVNNAFCKMIGYSPSEIIGRNAGDTFLPESSKTIIKQRLEERKEGLSSVYELQMQRKDGTLVWGLLSGAPIRNAQGKIIGSIGIQFDLTERKQLEHELADAKLIADRARLAERQFLTHMSHEIRTPINAVIGMTHLLDETQPTATQKEYLNSLRFSADSLLGIVDNILDLSKIDAGEITFERKAFDLDYLIKSLLSTFQFKIEQKDLQIVQTVDPAIKNLVIGDPTRTNQILTNLLGNALKFTEKGIISLTIQLLHHAEGSYLLEFRVHDTGMGISADKLETIFEYFKQADVQINRKYGGTGLGLTIVRQLVERQGGSIRVESQPGVGSDFIIIQSFGDSGIPVRDQFLIPETDGVNRKWKTKGLHFLIVEDNLMNQILICKTIQSWEATFEVANNGMEALEKTSLQRFDVMLMDIHMPVLDGFETTIAIRKDEKKPNRNTPILALTAAAMSDDKRRAFESGMNAFLTKPIAPKVLNEHILRCLYPIEAKELTYEPKLDEAGLPTDLSYLLELSQGDIQFVVSMIDAFLSETPAVLQNLAQAAQQTQWSFVYQLAHKLKPNFEILGMSHLQKQAADIEIGIQKKSIEPDKLYFMVQVLIAQTQATLPILAQQKRSFEAYSMQIISHFGK